MKRYTQLRALKASYQIFVKTPGTIPLEVTASESVWSVKTKVAAKAGFPPEVHRLIYGGRQLEDHKSLSDFSVAKEATLHLVPRVGGRPRAGMPADGAYQIYVKPVTGKTILLWATASKSVWSVKTEVAAETGWPPQAQVLIYAGERLEDHKSLSNFSVAKEATLHVAYVLRQHTQAPAPAQEPQP